MSTIAFCGLGKMGAAMAARLRDGGHELHVWNRSKDKAQHWAAGGGVVCDSPSAAAKGATEAHLMLADDDAVDATLFGAHGVLAALERGAVVVDHSTVSVAGARTRSQRIVKDGWRFLQAPVFGSPPQMASGEGLMLIGGEQQTYQTIASELQQIAGRHVMVGKPEEAAAFKLMGNCMLVAVVEGLAEIFAIARASGISAERAMQLFDSFNPCGTIARRGPRIAHGDYSPATFELTMGLKDVRLMIEAAGNDGLVPGLQATAAKMQRLIQDGYGQLDLAALGVEVVPPRGGEQR
ncbi:MAG: NAD(P)-dependent oxidoreductase [Candidatus Eremiobacteraeota bacterium]|nr:NAD(P)-dependent oxidoreductase [Candidatus Eremiobacteraeota bacterium]MBV8461102.1 NAD(P)-dependent oxidoreductase [Candidatus Eremiobacteraeota bacterium]MBV8670341.1 NAD(P)-dependent oxidoreductase [Candidatus Eremiobacteraeota bacterium]